MTTAAPERPRTSAAREEQPPPVIEEPTPRWQPVAAVLVLWFLVWLATKGTSTLELGGRDKTPVMNSLTAFRDTMLAGRDSNPVMQLTGAIADLFRSFVGWLQRLVSVPAEPRPVPHVGWLGVTAVATWVGYAVANWRIALLVLGTFLSYGVLGFWTDSMDLLIIVGISVAISLLIGLPLGILAGTKKRANQVIEPVLDLLQTMPTFVYLLPIVLFFGIGASSAVVCTVLYAAPPLIRISAHGIRAVDPAMIEVTNSLGQTRWQRLLRVQLPLAKRTIIVGLNQTTMAALSMATIASFVDGPGLGQPVLAGLRINDVGTALIPGLLIVATAIMLDRMTTAASERGDAVARGEGLAPRTHRIVLGAGGLVALVAVYLSREQFWAAEWADLGLGRRIAEATDGAVDSFTTAISPATSALKDGITYGLLNPLQSFLAESPWWLAFAGIALIALVIGGYRALLVTVPCLVGIWYFGLWHNAMITLAMTLVATALCMVLAVVVGVAMARRRSVDLAVRPILDAGQTIPAFVYLVPVLVLFGPSRFTGIVAALAYAAPVAIKLVADGVKGVSPTTMEAVRSTGATTMQQIRQVQLPMAKPSLVLAANQGLLFVLAMAVIAGMVGAGALGYDVVIGFSRSEEWGKGAAAGITIVLLGIMLDRIARRAASPAPKEMQWLRFPKPF
ncbi:ABC transporter permease [Oryzobacter sp. R7]|uniref:ABC transporter permease n=1 Tax=Oryzobacter faecalis TaxID=3388656 RepID=UPI00398D2909